MVVRGIQALSSAVTGAVNYIANNLQNLKVEVCFRILRNTPVNLKLSFLTQKLTMFPFGNIFLNEYNFCCE